MILNILYFKINVISERLERILTGSIIFILSYLAIKYQHHYFWMTMDDGFYAEAAHRMNIGQIPHRDFHDFHPGLIQYTHLLAFKIFGESITSLRIPLLIIGSLLPVISYTIFCPYGRLHALIAALIAFSFGVILIMNPSSNWYAVTFALIAIYLLSNQKIHQSTMLQLLVGCVIGICFLYRSLNGAFLGMGCLVYLYSQRPDSGNFKEYLLARIVLISTFLIIGFYVVTRNSLYGAIIMGSPILIIISILFLKIRCNTRNALKQLATLLGGVVIAVSPLLIYYASIGNLHNWIEDVFILPVTLINLEYIDSQRYHWSLLNGFNLVSKIQDPFELISLLGWIFLLTLPFSTLILLIYGYLTKKIYFVEWCNPLTIIGLFYIVAVLHYEILLYLIWGILPALLGFYMICLKFKGHWRNIFASLSVIMCIITLSTNLAYPMWYQSTENLFLGRIINAKLMNLPGSPDTLVLDSHQNYAELIKTINRLAPHNGKIFTYPGNPDITFLSRRNNPTAHIIPGITINSKKKLEQVIQYFYKNPPDIIVSVKTDRYNHHFHRSLDKFIRTHFIVAKELPDFVLYIPANKLSTH